MPITADRPETSTAIRTDLGAIFVSLELSRSTWLITSLSPGGRAKMSKHPVRGGDVAGLLGRFELLQEKAQARTGKVFPVVAIQEAGLDGFWIHRANHPKSGSLFHANSHLEQLSRPALGVKLDQQPFSDKFLRFTSHAGVRMGDRRCRSHVFRIRGSRESSL
jgi:hypothetical protein